MRGLEPLFGLMICGLILIRTMVDRRCLGPLDVGLPFNADAFPDAIGDGSNWKGFPLLLLVLEASVEACESCCERRAFPAISLNATERTLCAGDPFSDTVMRDCRRGVLLLWYGVPTGTSEMRLRRTASAVLTLGIESTSASLVIVRALSGLWPSDCILSTLLLIDPRRLCMYKLCSGLDCGRLFTFGR